jgi:hypothetical protein
MTDMTTEQRIPFTFEVDDFRGKAVGIDGDPVGATSDATVATVEITKVDDTHWSGHIIAGLEGQCRITITADADPGSAVVEVIGTADVTVTRDPRTDQRVVKLDLGAAEDKPAV